MKRFWALYRKEVRFLAGPGVALIGINLISSLFMLFMWKVFPQYYQQYIMVRLDDSIITLILKKILTIDGIMYMFPVILLYSFLFEHSTRSRTQLFQLPVKRWSLIAAKFAAIHTWHVVYVITFVVYGIVGGLLSHASHSVYKT